MMPRKLKFDLKNGKTDGQTAHMLNISSSNSKPLYTQPVQTYHLTILATKRSKISTILIISEGKLSFNHLCFVSHFLSCPCFLCHFVNTSQASSDAFRVWKLRKSRGPIKRALTLEHCRKCCVKRCSFDDVLKNRGLISVTQTIIKHFRSKTRYQVYSHRNCWKIDENKPGIRMWTYGV